MPLKRTLDKILGSISTPIVLIHLAKSKIMKLFFSIINTRIKLTKICQGITAILNLWLGTFLHLHKMVLISILPWVILTLPRIQTHLPFTRRRSTNKNSKNYSIPLLSSILYGMTSSSIMEDSLLLSQMTQT